jgi:hypothetical protein
MAFKEFVDGVRAVVELAIPVVVGLAFLSYVWGITKFIFKAGDAAAHKEGRNLLIWGTVALFVLFSLWGILRFLHNELELAPSSTGDFGLPLFRAK